MNASSGSAGDERKTVEVKAATADEAIARGLVRLGGLSRDEVKIEIVSEGRSGLLGFGAEDACVAITPLSPEDAAALKAKRDAERAAKKAEEQAVARAAEAKIAARAKPKPVAAEVAPPKPVARPRKKASPAKPARESGDSPMDGEPSVSPAEVIEIAQEVVGTLLANMGFDDATTEVKTSLLPVDIEGEEALVLSIKASGTNRLTAKGARTLYALQFVSRLIVSRRAGGWVNLLLDADDDRARRIKEIFMMAEQSAQLVERGGRAVSLPPMTPYERRVVHLALRNHDQIATQSIGDGPGRKVTVRRKDQVLPEL